MTKKKLCKKAIEKKIEKRTHGHMQINKNYNQDDEKMKMEILK
jgi:hypothetical protein